MTASTSAAAASRASRSAAWREAPAQAEGVQDPAAPQPLILTVVALSESVHWGVGAANPGRGLDEGPKDTIGEARTRRERALGKR